MRTTHIRLPQPFVFYGLILGSFALGFQRKQAPRAPGTSKIQRAFHWVADSILREPYTMYGFFTSKHFFSLSNFPRFSQEEIKQALVRLVYAEGTFAAIRDVLKYEIGYPISPSSMKKAELVLAGKLVVPDYDYPPHKNNPNSVEYKSGVTNTDTQPSASTLKSIQNLQSFLAQRKAVRENRAESRRLAAIQYKLARVEDLRIALAHAEEDLANMEKQSPHSLKDEAPTS